MLEFVIPIFYSEKPSQVTMTIENTMFGAYTGKRKVDWALVMRDMIRRLLTGIGKSKPTPICPYLFHFYIAHDIIQPDNKKVYMVGKSFIVHDIEPEEDDQPGGSKDSDRENLSSREIWELQEQQKKKEASLPGHKVTLTSGRKDKAPQVEERPEEPKRRIPFSVIADSLNKIRERCACTRKVSRAPCVQVGAEDKDYLPEVLRELPQK